LCIASIACAGRVAWQHCFDIVWQSVLVLLVLQL
jgi:hypothetical protein